MDRHPTPSDHATVSSVRQFGLASDPFVTEEITLLSPSLSVTTP
jgi:hypothetical protein